MTRTWIVYNKPKEPSYTHAGMLMGLGLTGKLGLRTPAYKLSEHEQSQDLMCQSCQVQRIRDVLMSSDICGVMLCLH